jgi:hypothetical protein
VESLKLAILFELNNYMTFRMQIRVGKGLAIILRIRKKKISGCIFATLQSKLPKISQHSLSTSLKQIVLLGVQKLFSLLKHSSLWETI